MRHKPMKRIILSLSMLAVTAVIGAGATGAFLSDTEVSAGNTFTAGAIDLKVDNESYYNGNACVLGNWDNDSNTANTYTWQGTQTYPVPGTPCTTSWELDDLDKGLLFFNFRDLKPDDEGEDTISLHVNDNDAYMCMDMTLTSNNDNSSTEPELASPDAQEDINNTWDGELAGLLQMVWWVDDGDNVLETGENLLNGGPKSLTEFFGGPATTTFSADLADATTNVWTGVPGPVTGDKTYYLAKAFCYGTLTEDRVIQDNLGKTGANGPMNRGTGISCDGKTLGDESQTDGATLDVAFRVVQARNNPGYTCNEEQPRTAKLTVIKEVINDNGGNNIVADFQLSAVGTVVTPVTSGVQTTFAAGNYAITETGIPGYVPSFGGDCNSVGQITLNPGDVKTCTITNNDRPAIITVVKNVINNNGGLLEPVQFLLLVDNILMQNNTSTTTNANVSHTIGETLQSGYSFISMVGISNYGQLCPATLGGSIVLAEGENITCTITNDDIAP